VVELEIGEGEERRLVFFFIIGPLFSLKNCSRTARVGGRREWDEVGMRRLFARGTEHAFDDPGAVVPATSKRFDHEAQGCEVRATLGHGREKAPTPKGLKQLQPFQGWRLF
jgi:hypothetical protein